MHSNTTTRSHGFTIIELMLAMAFFSTILALSAATFVQVITVYNKGVAVKQMNQASRSLADSLIRNASSESSSVTLYPAAGVNGAKCIRLGSVTYLLSYANETSATTSAYRFTGTLEPVNFVRYNAPNQPCPSLPGALINPTLVSPVIGGTLRVYRTDITQVGSQTNLLRFNVLLGTFSGPGDPANPAFDGVSITCPLNEFGDFCATSTYETVLYLPNNGGGA